MLFLPVEAVICDVFIIILYYCELIGLPEFLFCWVVFGLMALGFGYVNFSNWKYVNDGMKKGAEKK